MEIKQSLNESIVSLLWAASSSSGALFGSEKKKFGPEIKYSNQNLNQPLFLLTDYITFKTFETSNLNVNNNSYTGSFIIGIFEKQAPVFFLSRPVPSHFVPSLFGYSRFFLCPDIVYNLLQYGHADHLFRSFALHQIDTEVLQAHISRVLGCVLPRESLQSGPLLNAPLCQRFLHSQAPRSFGQGVKSGFFVIFRRLYRLGIDDNVWPGDNGFTLRFCVVKCISQSTTINTSGQLASR